MNNFQGKREFKEEKESLHWINYNVKQLVEQMKAISQTLDTIKAVMVRGAKESIDESPF